MKKVIFLALLGATIWGVENNAMSGKKRPRVETSGEKIALSRQEPTQKKRKLEEKEGFTGWHSDDEVFTQKKKKRKKKKIVQKRLFGFGNERDALRRAQNDRDEDEDDDEDECGEHDGQEELYDEAYMLCYEGKCNQLKTLIDTNELDVNRTIYGPDFDDGTTLLHMACLMGHFDIVQLLTKNYKADFKRVTEADGYRPLCHAYDQYYADEKKCSKKEGYEKIISYFFDELNYIVCRDDDSDIFYCACVDDNMDMIQFLYSKGYLEKYCTNVSNQKRLLCLLTDIFSFEVLRYFIETIRCDINQPIDEEENTMLHNVCESPEGLDLLKIKFVDYLLDKGAQLFSKKKDGFFPSTLALMYGYVETGKYLQNIEHNNYQGFTTVRENNFLIQACKSLDFERILELIEARGNVKIKTKNNELPSTLVLQQHRNFSDNYDTQVMIGLVGSLLQKLELGRSDVSCKSFYDTRSRGFCSFCEEEIKPHSVVARFPCLHVLHAQCAYEKSEYEDFICDECKNENANDVEHKAYEETDLQLLIYDPGSNYFQQTKILYNPIL